MFQNSYPTLYNYEMKSNLIFTKNITKFQINDCFKTTTHEPVVFALYFDR